MTIPNVPYTFTPGTTIYSAQVNADFASVVANAAPSAGVTTNSNAAAGQVGEYIQSDVPVGTPVSLTSTDAANVTSISLTAGDWDVVGNVLSIPGSGTTTSIFTIWIDTVTTDASPTEVNGLVYCPPGTANLVTGGTTGVVRMSLATTTTVYLEVNATFAVSTLKAYGLLRARRVR
jgi:hypothetical protein